MNMIKERNASAFLLLNAILWGSSYIWSKILLGYLPYFTILFAFSSGGLAALSILFYKRIKGIGGRTLLIGMGAGILSILSNICCMLALKGTSSSNTAFIVQMSVIITPMIMSVAEKKLPCGKTIFSAFAALTGLLLLTCDFSSFSFKPGDLFALGNALFFSLYLAVLKIYSGRTDPVQFTFMQHVAGTVAFLGLALFYGKGRIEAGNMNILAFAILLLSILISVSTILIQTTAIKFIRPEKATIIYTLEPVAAAVFAFLLIGERPAGVRAFAGCILILFAVACSVYKKQRTSTQMQMNNVKYTYLQPAAEIRRKEA